MRTIKFRGVDIKSGKTVYGDYLTAWAADQTGPRIRACTFDYKDAETGATIAGLIYYDVKPGSVEQLIGVDANGCEVYEGDKVVRIKEWLQFIFGEQIFHDDFA